MAKRILTIDHSDYSNKEIQDIQRELNTIDCKITVFKDILRSGKVALCAVVPVKYSVSEVIDMVGEAYINGVSG